MMDLGFSGPRYTWSNVRQHGQSIRERIDIMFCTPEWQSLFCETQKSCIYLSTHSDHCPVLLNTNGQVSFHIGQVRPFRFETVWFSDPSFFDVVRNSWGNNGDLLSECMDKFTRAVQVWNRESFGNIFNNNKKKRDFGLVFWVSKNL